MNEFIYNMVVNGGLLIMFSVGLMYAIKLSLEYLEDINRQLKKIRKM
jgi:hypothetical protein